MQATPSVQVALCCVCALLKKGAAIKTKKENNSLIFIVLQLLNSKWFGHEQASIGVGDPYPTVLKDLVADANALPGMQVFALQRKKQILGFNRKSRRKRHEG
jgi:hypothetical protein